MSIAEQPVVNDHYLHIGQLHELSLYSAACRSSMETSKSTSRVSNSDFGPPMASSKSVINSSGDHVLKLRLHGRFAHAHLDATAVRKRLPTRVGSLL